MKKITFTLLTALGLSTAAFGQANVVIQAPLTDGSWSTLHAPSGSASAVYHRACYLVTQAELTGLATTNSIVTGFGFDFLNGVNAATAGSFSVYLQNTTDVAYLKGTNYAAAIAPMSLNFNGTYNIPVSTGVTQTILNLTNQFTYTGGGIYVALDWYGPSAAATTPARYNCNTTDLTPTGGSYTFTSVGPAPTTMSLDVFRPAFLWQAANTATNEVSIESMYALGKVSKLFTAGHVITAELRNNSANALTNIPVTLTSAGANTFNDVKTISSLAAGATTVISFSPFNPTTGGLNNLSVSIPNDQDNNNNDAVWSQTVTCNDFAFIPPLAASSFTDGPWGFNTDGIYAYEFTPPSACNLTGVNMVVAQSTTAVGNNIVGVVVDLSGSILATTNTITITGAMLQTQQTMVFDTPFPMTGGTNYYIGVAALAGSAGYFVYPTLYPTYAIPNFYRGAPIGSALSQADRGYIAIGAVVNTGVTDITATATRTLFCKNGEPKTATLTASGLSTYTWTPGGQGASIVVSPTIAGTTGTGTVNYFVTGTDAASGCKSSALKISAKIIACTGLADNNSNGYAINVFPNPAVNGKSTVSGLVGTNVITVYNTLGQVVLNQTVSTETSTIDLSNQSSGNYVVKITDSNNESRIIKMINQN